MAPSIGPLQIVFDDEKPHKVWQIVARNNLQRGAEAVAGRRGREGKKLDRKRRLSGSRSDESARLGGRRGQRRIKDAHEGQAGSSRAVRERRFTCDDARKGRAESKRVHERKLSTRCIASRGGREDRFWVVGPNHGSQRARAQGQQKQPQGQF